jgi:gliding motility-associated-like protein
MRPALEQYELIDRFLNNNLSDTELVAFQNRLASDAALREELKVYQQVNELIVDQGLLEVKAKLKALDTSADPGSGSKSYLYTSIAVVAIAVIGFLAVRNNEEPAVVPAREVVPAPVTRELNSTPETAQIKKPGTKLSPTTASENKQDSEVARTIESSETATPVSETPIADVDPTSQVHATETVQEEKPQPNAIDCALEESDLKVISTSSCNNSPTGSITIEETSHFKGKLPVRFSLNAKDFSDVKTFKFLEAGTYYLSVKDSDGCIWSDAKEIVVPERDCREREEAFYPDRGETWKFPAPQTGSCKIEIYNRTGALVYKTNIVNGQPGSWDGTSDGQALPMGSYTYRITNGDETSIGSVTILR